MGKWQHPTLRGDQRLLSASDLLELLRPIVREGDDGARAELLQVIVSTIERRYLQPTVLQSDDAFAQVGRIAVHLSDAASQYSSPEAVGQLLYLAGEKGDYAPALYRLWQLEQYGELACFAGISEILSRALTATDEKVRLEPTEWNAIEREVAGRARRWLERAASLGYPPAQVDLALWEIQGVGPSHPKRLEKLLLDAATADNPDPDARYVLACLYDNASAGLNMTDETVTSQYRLSADQGHPLAALKLAQRFEAGKGTSQDKVAALGWYARGIGTLDSRQWRWSTGAQMLVHQCALRRCTLGIELSEIGTPEYGAALSGLRELVNAEESDAVEYFLDKLPWNMTGEMNGARSCAPEIAGMVAREQDLSNEARELLEQAVDALYRMPTPTPSIEVAFGVGGTGTWVDVTISPYSLVFSTGGSVDEGHGSDSYSSTVQLTKWGEQRGSLEMGNLIELAKTILNSGGRGRVDY